MCVYIQECTVCVCEKNYMASETSPSVSKALEQWTHKQVEQSQQQTLVLLMIPPICQYSAIVTVTLLCLQDTKVELTHGTRCLGADTREEPAATETLLESRKVNTYRPSDLLYCIFHM